MNLFLVFCYEDLSMMLEKNIILIFVLGAYSLLIAVFSVKLLRQRKVRIKFFAGILLSAWAMLNYKDLIIYLALPEPIQFNWIIMFDQLIVPCVGITLYEMYWPRRISYLAMLGHFSPFVLLFLIYCIYPAQILIYVSNLVVVVYSSMIIWSAVSSLRLNRHNEQEKKAIRKITNSFVGVVIVWILTCISPDPIWEIIYFIVSGILWCIIYHYIDTTYQLPSEVEMPMSADKSEHPFTALLQKLFAQDRIFLNSELALNDVARLIGTNRSYLSEYFNHELSTTFSDYVNNWRISHAESLIVSNCSSSIEEIAVSSGFNSISTFRRAFIKKHGVTPSQYRQNHKTD